MVVHHVGATKKTDINRELTNCNTMLIKKKELIQKKKKVIGVKTLTHKVMLSHKT